ncbi:hypothetical protein [Spiroplasma endosymbiont of Seladonia tumulorum]|uniref:hypothetical protein n=1 Tax=Spiroplasma endosymbiont of Seladonia tumulorum TaxID=3066321 RepID=UPI0030CFD4E8
MYEEFIFKNNKKIITCHILGSELKKLIEKQARGNQSAYSRQINDLEKESNKNNTEPINFNENDILWD